MELHTLYLDGVDRGNFTYFAVHPFPDTHYTTLCVKYCILLNYKHSTLCALKITPEKAVQNFANRHV